METSANERDLGDWCAQRCCSPSGSAFCPVTFQSLESQHAEQTHLGSEGKALLAWAPASHLPVQIWCPVHHFPCAHPAPTGPVESEVGCGHHEQGRWNDPETAKLTHSVSFRFMFMGEKNERFSSIKEFPIPVTQKRKMPHK